MRTITVSTWGKMGLGEIRVRVDEYASESQSAARSIERRTGLEFCGGPRHDGTSQGSCHYHGTLGEHLRTGGYSVVGEIWFAIGLPR